MNWKSDLLAAKDFEWSETWARKADGFETGSEEEACDDCRSQVSQ